MKEWTIMVYMAGDNDLSEDMTKRLIEMRTIFDQKAESIKTANIGLCAYLDGDNPTLVTKQYNFNNGVEGIPITNVQRGSNSANKLTIRDFVDWCVNDQKADAEKYALFISGHGDGFQQTSFLRDATSSDSMTVKDLKDILLEINQKILKKPKLDLICFDSCVMNTIEVAAEFQQVAEMMVGSQGYLPTTGWSYQRIVDGLIALDEKKKPITNQEIASVVVEAATENNRQFSELTKRSLDMSVYDLSETKINLILEAINSLAEVLESGLATQLTSERDFVIKRPVKKVLLNAHWKSQTCLFDQAVDMIDFCENLKVECLGLMFQFGTLVGYSGVKLTDVSLNGGEVSDVKIASGISAEDSQKFADVLSVLQIMQAIADASQNLRDRVDDCILKSCFSGPDFQFCRGMSLLLPWSKVTFDMIQPKLDNFSFKKSKWIGFLRKYLEETLRVSQQDMLKRNLSVLAVKFLTERTMFTGGTMVDPPPAAQLVTNSQYKDYFMRTKNFPLDDVNLCTK